MESVKAASRSDVVEAGLGLVMMRELSPTLIGPCFPVDPLQFRQRVEHWFSVFTAVGVELSFTDNSTVQWTWAAAPKGCFTDYPPNVVKEDIHDFFDHKDACVKEHEAMVKEKLNEHAILPPLPPPPFSPTLPTYSLSRSP
jgi:hypothetical protein